ncbi:MAG: aldehyde dehydrogenase family protein [Thermoanaerobaculales bacterium]|jgi:aldehyde dehydrogenase (NAD+)|nr:aldehyde dehydrogenase family protein [Thermoanaerobaculales bacterium]
MSDTKAILDDLGLRSTNSGACTGAWITPTGGGEVVSVNPTTGEPIASVIEADAEAYEQVVATAAESFFEWRMMPAPARGEIVRELGNELRKVKEPLGRLVTLEMGKILSEGLGEVQEMIDMCDFAVGLSRQLYGPTMMSERPRHRMYEQWHPLGVVGIISAFNFPVAVWSWNAALAAVCGDTMVWKPSSSTPLTAVAVQNICNTVMERHGLHGIFNLTIGPGSVVGERMINDPRVPLVSFTGSTGMGRHVSEACAKRFGRSILELGGNNAILVEPDANLDLALRAILFAAVGTAGQRCTSLRRLFLHSSIADEMVARLVKAYGSITIGDPLSSGILMGPLVNEGAIRDYEKALVKVREQGGEIICGGKRIDRPGFFVEPTIVRLSEQIPIACDETFAPILYVLTYDDLGEAIRVHNSVQQGLSSAVFTSSMYSAERFLSHEGSDCGIANVNIGTSGAEIGGAFGGEKETGGGREAGSDAWKTYMRRQTCTINWSTALPLAQGVSFDVE